MSCVVVAALYKFVNLPDYVELRQTLTVLGKQAGIRGTLLLAQEGINGTVAGTREGIDQLKEFLQADKRFEGIEYKESFTDKMPFYRLKVKLKKEIVTLGCPEANPNKQVGTYVAPQDWNALIQDPDVIVVDTRNDYEVQLGTFKGSLNPHTRYFREFPEFVEKELSAHKDKKIAMSCTGGIRCEKATSYLLAKGFKDVYHLKGGILKYLEEVPSSESLWEGDCFVFDERVSVGEGVQAGDYSLCRGCRMPLSEEDKKSPHYERGVSCAQCYDTTSPKKKESARQRQRQIDQALKKGEVHMGASYS